MTIVMKNSSSNPKNGIKIQSQKVSLKMLNVEYDFGNFRAGQLLKYHLHIHAFLKRFRKSCAILDIIDEIFHGWMR